MNCKSKLVKPWNDLCCRSIIGTPKLAGKFDEDSVLLNESFLRDQIAGMKKIDKLVEEAEQSISKVVQGFDKFFKEPPPKGSRQAMDSSDIKRKIIEFDLDDSCDCPDELRCDCETKDGSNDRISLVLSDSISDNFSDAESIEHNSDHLNTISERTETADTSDSIVSHDVKSVCSEMVYKNDVPLRVRNIKKDANITIDTQDIVHIIPADESFEQEPILQDTANGTDDFYNPYHSNSLEIQTLPGVEIKPSCVVQKIYNININPTGNRIDQSDVCPNRNTIYIELKHDDHIVQSGCIQNNAVKWASEEHLNVTVATGTCDKIQEIQVIKAPNSGMFAQDSSQQPVKLQMGPKCCAYNRDIGTSQDKDQAIDQIFDEIMDFQIPIVSTTSRSLSSNDMDDDVADNSSSTLSEYVVVQDNATQVSAHVSTDIESPPSSNCCDISMCQPTMSPQAEIGASVSTGNNTSTNTFPTNVRLPIPGLPIGSYLPVPYDYEEVDEILISTKSLEDPDIMPFDLFTTQEEKVEKEMPIVAGPPVEDKYKIVVAKPVVQTRNHEDDPDSFDFIGEDCSFESMLCVKKPSQPNMSDIDCLSNAYDFNAAHDASGVNIICFGKVTETRTGNEDECVVVKNVIRCCKQKSEETKAICQATKRSKKDSVNVPIDPGVETPTSKVERPATIRPKSADVSTNFNPPESDAPALDLEGVQIMDPVYSHQRAPPGVPRNANTTAMSAMVEYDQRGVAESLAQNLLLAQLNDRKPAPIVTYRKIPTAYFESSSSDNSSHSSTDYPERYKYLIQAKRGHMACQRGIITEDSDDVIPSRSPDRGDPISDGEMSNYTSSVGEVLPIGPKLLKSRNFMRRRPDKIFQMELMQRDMHVQRQYNYFNNWVSYYVQKNQPANR